MDILIKAFITFVPAIIAITAHEVAHGLVAAYLGDDTAKKNKRLSLNPMRHIDIFGTIILPAILILSKTGFIFGWAKPVPINYNNLKKPKRDIVLVASAGIIMNLYLALIGALLIYLCSFIPTAKFQLFCTAFCINFMVFNIILAVFNILPIPPLDGSKIFFGWSENPWAIKYVNSTRIGLIIIVALAFVIPVFMQTFGINFDVLGWYIKNTTRTLGSILM